MTDEPDSVDELISRYLDGDATEAEISRVEGDPALLARAESMRAAIGAVAAPVAIPEAELDRIRALAIAESATTEQVTDLATAAARRSAERRNRILAIAAAFVFLAVGVVAIQSLPGGDDDDDTASEASDATADTSTDDSGDAGSDDAATEESAEAMSSFGDADMAEEDDTAEEDGEDTAEEEEAPEADVDDTAADADADDSADAPAEDGAATRTFASIDLLPDELPRFADDEALIDTVLEAYEDGIDAENAIGLTEDELFAELCPEAVDLVLASLPADLASIELVTTELGGSAVTVIVAAGADGTIAVLSHPVDDCAVVEPLAVVPPS